MIQRLERLVDDLTSLNSNLILLIGPPRSGKTALLAELATRKNVSVLNLGVALGRRLLTVPMTRRPILVSELMKNLADDLAIQRLLLIDNIELLFDPALSLHPVDFLKRNAHRNCVVCAWPGELQGCRISYSFPGHPEYRDYGIDGLVPFEIN